MDRWIVVVFSSHQHFVVINYSHLHESVNSFLFIIVFNYSLQYILSRSLLNPYP